MKTTALILHNVKGSPAALARARELQAEHGAAAMRSSAGPHQYDELIADEAAKAAGKARDSILADMKRAGFKPGADPRQVSYRVICEYREKDPESGGYRDVSDVAAVSYAISVEVSK